MYVFIFCAAQTYVTLQIIVYVCELFTVDFCLCLSKQRIGKLRISVINLVKERKREREKKIEAFELGKYEFKSDTNLNNVLLY